MATWDDLDSEFESEKEEYDEGAKIAVGLVATTTSEAETESYSEDENEVYSKIPREELIESLKELLTMIPKNNLAKHFWAEAVNTACYVQNRIYIRPILEKTTYELFKGRKPNISYFHQFGCICYILNNKLYLKKFDAKAQRGIFVGYFERSKAYKVYNSETLCVEESMHVKFDDKELEDKTSKQVESSAEILVS